MNKSEYLISLSKENKVEELYRTWVALGCQKVNNNTKVYTKDTLFQVTEDGDLKNALIWCNYTYTVDPDNGFDHIDWTIAQADKIEKEVYFYQGVASPNFKIICDSFAVSTVNDAELNTQYEVVTVENGDNTITYKAKTIVDDFIPFKNAQIKTSSINISDEEYNIIAAELGVPFLTDEELEYNRSTIIDICIKPALDQYYAYFPIIIDEGYGEVPTGQDWEYEYHSFEEDPTAVAYKGLPYITVGSMSGTSSGYTSALSFLREQYIYGGGSAMGGRWGGGVSYRKAVPGFTGASDSVTTSIYNMAARQASMNMYRREYERDVFKNGKKYLHGHTTIGGCLNIHWLCMSTDFSRVDYWMLPQVRKLCTAYALRNIGMLRALVKPNETNLIDYSLYTTRADALEKEVLDVWAQSPSSLMLAIKRGGLNF